MSFLDIFYSFGTAIQKNPGLLPDEPALKILAVNPVAETVVTETVMFPIAAAVDAESIPATTVGADEKAFANVTLLSV